MFMTYLFKSITSNAIYKQHTDYVETCQYSEWIFSYHSIVKLSSMMAGKTRAWKIYHSNFQLYVYEKKFHTFGGSAVLKYT